MHPNPRYPAMSNAAATEPYIDRFVRPADEIKTTTSYMSACRCATKVRRKDGEVRYIEGNPGHLVNSGVLYGKGSQGITRHHSPPRLRAPLLTVGPRGTGEFKELNVTTGWLDRVRKEAGYRCSNTDPTAGQADAYDLRLRIQRSAPQEAGATEPTFGPLLPPLPLDSCLASNFGAAFPGTCR